MIKPSAQAGRLMSHCALFISTILGSCSTVAMAQSLDEQNSANRAAATADNNYDDSSAIVVTAQGRSQLLSDVPVSISAVSAEALKNSGANDIRQLNQVAPSLSVSSTGSEANGSARIRGIGTVGDNPGLESSVPVFIDGVYRSRSGIGLNELGEIDRVEVQRGPQGTLGGRNSSAGMISIYSALPKDEFALNAEATYGNYDYWRFGGSVTGPIGEGVSARLDGVYVKRDGFYRDETNDTDVNNRNRYFLRGQLLLEPNDNLTVRLIGDYTWRKEKCCAAIFVDSSVNPYIGNLNELAEPLLQPGASSARVNDGGNNIVNVLRDLGQPLASFNQGYSRNIHVTPGRSFAGKVKDYGFSGQIDWDFDSAKLTSITAYREYRASQAGDLDYGSVDILYRGVDEDSYRQFHTFTQELRLQGEAFDGKLDWLVGGFYANERLTLNENLRFGNQYGRFATCRIVSGSGLAAYYSPTSNFCMNPAAAPTVLGVVTGASAPDILAGFTALDGINDRGSVMDRYTQKGENWAIFTHNIIHITDKLDLTLGARYTWDKKRLNASFSNDNVGCVTVQNLLLDDLTTTTAGTPTQIATARALAAGLIGLACQGNSTAELDGVSINSKRKEDRWTGTAILSFKPTDDLLIYGSASRGYKAGGFNLDRSALKSPVLPFGGQAGAQALAGNLQFDPELVDAYEIGAKYATGPFSLGVTLFRSELKNFQLNTFNGTSFIVKNINGCKSSLNGDDRDQSKFAGGANYDANASATGACPAEDVGWGVRAQGVELEASLAPARDFRVSAGFTYARTKYRNNLVNDSTGAPLEQALRLLPGQLMSNAPEFVTTVSMAWTPEIGSNGLSGLIYVDGRMSSDANTGSDLFPQKIQDGFALVNARLGLRGREDAWGLELWAQNIFNKQYAQVAFNAPFQEGGTSPNANFSDAQYPGGRQLFAQFLAEPRTYGITLRGKY